MDEYQQAQFTAAEQMESKHERVTSMMMAMLVIVAVVALFLGLLWLTNQLWQAEVAIGVELIDIVAGDAEGGMDTRWDDTLAEVENLAPEDMPDELIPETEMVPPAIMTDIAKNVALLDDPSEEDNPDNTGQSGSPGPSEGIGGDTFGIRGSGKQRGWMLSYGSNRNLQEYARMLDHFGIELAMKVGQDELVYVSRLASSDPRRRSGRGSRDNRLHWGWQMGSARRASDVKLLRKAGLIAGRRVVVQFIPMKLERELLRMEKQRAGGRPRSEIRVTHFSVRPKGGGYEFYVVSQTYMD